MKSLLLVVLLISAAAAQYMNGQDDEEDRLQAYHRSLVLQRLQQLRRQGHFQSVDNEKEAATRAIMAAIKKKCEENGPSGAYDKLERAVEEAQTCVLSAIANTPQSTYGGIRESVRYICRLAPHIGRCIINLSDAAKPCIPSQRRENLHVANLTHSLINYACDNDGEKVHAFIVGDGPACARNSLPQVKQCSAKVDKEELVNSIENSIESGEVSETKCKESREVMQCMVNELDSCPTPAASTFFKGMFDVVNKFSPCAQLDQPSENLISVQRIL